MDDQAKKLMRIEIAAILAAGVISNKPDTRPSDPNLSSEENLDDTTEAMRLTHAFYEAIKTAEQTWQ